jgi:hypothetical protein
MRFKSSRLLLVLVALFAISAVAAASASAALPEIVNKEGKALVKNSFTGETRLTEFASTSTYIGTVRCESSAGVTGKFSGVKAGETTFTLKTCTGGPVGGKCTTTGSKTGEMAIQFSLQLVYTSKASKELALLFTPHKPGHESEDVTYSCAGINFTMSGGFLVPIARENVNKLLEVGKYLYLDATSQQSVQAPSKYENEKGETVETYLETIYAGNPAKTGVNFDGETSFEEGVEFKG